MAGATVVFGGDAWFAMADANYSRSDLDTFDGAIDAWFLSSRLGLHRTIDRFQAQLWGGIGYIDAKRTLTITTDLPAFGPTTVGVEQEPTGPGHLSVRRPPEPGPPLGGHGRGGQQFR